MKCFVCSKDAHQPTDHTYWPLNDAKTWFNNEPCGSQIIPVIDGIVYTYGG